LTRGTSVGRPPIFSTAGLVPGRWESSTRPSRKVLPWIARLLGALCMMLLVVVWADSASYAAGRSPVPVTRSAVVVQGQASELRSGTASTPVSMLTLSAGPLSLLAASQLDPDQFEILLWGLGFVIALLAVHVVGSWRR
jgi:hypothetical protein